MVYLTAGHQPPTRGMRPCTPATRVSRDPQPQTLSQSHVSHTQRLASPQAIDAALALSMHSLYKGKMQAGLDAAR